MSDLRKEILNEINKERERQDKKFGKQSHQNTYFKNINLHPAGVRSKLATEATGIPTARQARDNYQMSFIQGSGNWSHILVEEIAESIEEAGEGNIEKLEMELIQSAAVCVAWIEDLRIKNEKRR